MQCSGLWLLVLLQRILQARSGCNVDRRAAGPEFAEEFAEQYAEEHGVEFSSKPRDCIYVTEAVFKQIVAYMAKDDPEQAEEVLEDMPDLKMPNELYKLDGYMETEIVD